MKIHTLKTWPEYFEAILNGTKTFEVRKNDRNFKVGDRLDLIEFDPNLPIRGQLTGKHCHRFISYILDTNTFVNLQGYVILGLRNQTKEKTASDDYKQYITNLLYNAYEDGKQQISTTVFDVFVEEQIELLKEFSQQTPKEQQVSDEMINKWIDKMLFEHRSWFQEESAREAIEWMREQLIKKG